MDKRISIIVILIILIFAVYMYRRSGSKKEAVKGGRKKGPLKKGKRGRPARESASEDKDDDKEVVKSADKDLVSDARELYGLVHADLAQGLQLDEFEDLAGDLAGENPEEVYIQLKQLYNEAIDNNKDPSKTVTVNDYAKVLEETD